MPTKEVSKKSKFWKDGSESDTSEEYDTSQEIDGGDDPTAGFIFDTLKRKALASPNVDANDSDPPTTKKQQKKRQKGSKEIPPPFPIQ